MKTACDMSSKCISYVMWTFLFIFPAYTKMFQLNTRNVICQILIQNSLSQWKLFTLGISRKENIWCLLEHSCRPSKCNSWRKCCKSHKRNFQQMFHSCLETKKSYMCIYILPTGLVKKKKKKRWTTGTSRYSSAHTASDPERIWASATSIDDFRYLSI